MTALRGMYIIPYMGGLVVMYVRQEPFQDISTKHTFSKLLDNLFSEAYHLKVPVYVMLAETTELSAY